MNEYRIRMIGPDGWFEKTIMADSFYTIEDGWLVLEDEYGKVFSVPKDRILFIHAVKRETIRMIIG